MQGKRYRGFISYIYRDNEWFLWLKNILESFKPSLKIIETHPNLGNFSNHSSFVFDDQIDYEHDSDIIELEKRAIDHSDNLFIICTKESRLSYEINEDAKYGLSDSYKGNVFFILIDDQIDSDKENLVEYLPQTISAQFSHDSALLENKIIDLRAISGNRAKFKLLSGLTGKEEKYFRFRYLSIHLILFFLIISIAFLSYLFLIKKDNKKPYVTSLSGMTGISRPAGGAEAKYLQNLIDILRNEPENYSIALELLSVLSEKVYPDGIEEKKENCEERCIISNDNLFMLYTSKNKGEVWDLKNKKLFFELNGHKENILSAGFSNNNKLIFTSSAEGIIRIWDAAYGSLLYNLGENKSKMLSAVFFNEGTKIITLSSDSSFQIWNCEDGGRITDPVKIKAKVIDFETTDGNWIIAFLENRKVGLINISGNLPVVSHWLLDLASFFASNLEVKITIGNNTCLNTLYQINSELYRTPDQDIYTEWGKWFLQKYFSKVINLPSRDFINPDDLGKIDPVIIKKLERIYSNPLVAGDIIANAAQNQIGKAYDPQSDISKTVTKYLLEYAIRFKPLNPKLWYDKGIFEYDDGNLAVAFYSFYKSILYKPDYWESWNYLGNLWMDLGTRKNSANALRRSLDIVFKKNNGLDPDYDYNTVGSLLMDLDERQYSLLAFKKELERNRYLEDSEDPNSKEILAISYGNIAFAELFNLHAKDAIISSLHGLKVDSTQLWLNINLSHSYILNNQFKKAREIYIKYGNLKLYEYDNKTLGEIILGDLDDLKKNGFYHPDMEKIVKLFSPKNSHKDSSIGQH